MCKNRSTHLTALLICEGLCHILLTLYFGGLMALKNGMLESRDNIPTRVNIILE